jgi:hypothetical protein
MAYTELKEKLERLLTEDLSNRSSLQDVRRNLFLNSEGAKVQQQLLAEKQGEISSLNLLVEKKKTILQLKDEQINSVTQKVKELEEKMTSAEAGFTSERNTLLEKIAILEQQVAVGSVNESKLTELSLQNEEFSAKIRELVFHIDGQNTEIESLKQQAGDKSVHEATAKLLEEKIAENAGLQERNDLLFASEQQLKVLVASQNNDIEALTKQTNGFKKQTEDIAAGWQMQQDQLIIDNANLLAELALVREASANVVVAETTPVVSEEELTALKTTNADLLAELELTKEDSALKVAELTSIKAEKEALALVNLNLFTEITQLKEAAQNTASPVSESLTEEQIAEIKAEKEHLAAELVAISHELNVVTQNREEKIISLQNEIGTLQNQLVSLSNSLNQETEQKNLIGTQVEQLTSLVTEKEQQLSGMSNNTADEEFVDKLMHQINFLTNQKNSFETMYHDSEAELVLTKANLASITQLVDGQKDSISGLEETNKHVKLAQTLVLQAQDKTEAKQAINELVREIDRCIALLSE